LFTLEVVEWFSARGEKVLVTQPSRLTPTFVLLFLSVSLYWLSNNRADSFFFVFPENVSPVRVFDGSGGFREPAG
jgi:hypothetical protein